MSCCGQARAKAMMEAKQRLAQPVQPHSVFFEYIGQTSLSVIGPATRTTYRFAAPGVRVPVDFRDATAFGAIRVLRRV